MAAGLVSAIRDLGDMYKVLHSHRSSTELQQQVSALERQISRELKNHSAASAFINSIPTCRGGIASSKHHPLTYSNSMTVPPSACNNTNNSKNAFSTREHRKLDRSVSEPVDKSQQQPRPLQSNSSRYKTELCRPFEESGTCKYGDKCQFAHGVGELRTLARHPKYKTELCRTFHTTGLCPYGPRCHFIHNDFNRSMTTGLQTAGINIPSSASQVGMVNPLALKDRDMGSFSIGSAGDISPNSSSISGSPISTNGFFMDDALAALSPVPSTPQTAPAVMSNAAFFGQDFVPFSSPPVASSAQSLQALQQALLNAEQQQSLAAPQVDLISSQLDNLNLRSNHSPTVDGNRNNIRLPIFNQLMFGGPD